MTFALVSQFYIYLLWVKLCLALYLNSALNVNSLSTSRRPDCENIAD